MNTELPEPRNPGQELADALGLNANDITSITIEPDGGGTVVVNVHSQVYLYGDDDDRLDAIIDLIKQYRLVPITDTDTRPLRDAAPSTPLPPPPRCTTATATSHAP